MLCSDDLYALEWSFYQQYFHVSRIRQMYTDSYKACRYQLFDDWRCLAIGTKEECVELSIQLSNKIIRLSRDEVKMHILSKFN